ncbi:hypothetical protein BaRGS_00033329 [Batillaria attramentaria]|uniref:Dolichol phosphate-mannose biosynthesis regulatory protein n=1 Tax=Batillaria attramentaria TaxID=370345 RepID=A0ABD0JKC5_9CAEN
MVGEQTLFCVNIGGKKTAFVLCELQATGHDQAVGWAMVSLSSVIFVYYTVWVIVLPFVEPGIFVHKLFPPRIVAIAGPLIAGVIALLLLVLKRSFQPHPLGTAVYLFKMPAASLKAGGRHPGGAEWVSCAASESRVRHSVNWFSETGYWKTRDLTG